MKKHKFKVGQKVTRTDAAFGIAIEGKTYTVKGYNKFGGLLLKEEKGDFTYAESSFELYGREKTNPIVKPAHYLGSAIIRKTRNGGFRVNLTGRNNERMYTSEVYTTKSAAMKTAKLMKDFEIIDKTK